jgi:hypothetical protein
MQRGEGGKESGKEQGASLNPLLQKLWRRQRRQNPTRHRNTLGNTLTGYQQLFAAN